MKILLAGLLLAQFTIPGRTGSTAVNGGGGPTLTYVQGCVNSASATTVSCPSITVTSGDLIVVTSKTQTSITGATLAATSASGVACTFTSLTSQWNTFGYSGDLAYCIPASSGAMTIAATWTGAVGTAFTDITAAQFHSTSGWNASPLDTSIGTFNATASTTCAAGPTSATTNANDLVVGVCQNFNAGQTYGAATGYTFQSASSRNTTGLWWKSVTATGTQSISTTITSDQFIGFVAAFKAN